MLVSEELNNYKWKARQTTHQEAIKTMARHFSLKIVLTAENGGNSLAKWSNSDHSCLIWINT